MSYRQLRKPNTKIKDYAGSCLRMTRTIYNVGSWWYTAWEAWDATEHFSRSRVLPNVSVPVWFDWSGYVPGLGTKRWGHVAAWIPGKGLLSSPMSGYGSKMYTSIAALERDMTRATGTPVTFVGWSLDINGVMVAEPAPTLVKKEVKKVPDYFSAWRTKKTGGKSKTVTTKWEPGEQTLTAGRRNQLHINKNKDVTVAHGGNYDLTASVFIEGEPGDRFSFGVLRGTWSKLLGWKQKAFLESVNGVISEGGSAQVQVTFSNVVPKGERLRLYVHPAKGSKRMKVTRLSLKGRKW